MVALCIDKRTTKTTTRLKKKFKHLKTENIL